MYEHIYIKSIYWNICWILLNERFELLCCQRNVAFTLKECFRNEIFIKRNSFLKFIFFLQIRWRIRKMHSYLNRWNQMIHLHKVNLLASKFTLTFLFFIFLKRNQFKIMSFCFTAPIGGKKDAFVFEPLKPNDPPARGNFTCKLILYFSVHHLMKWDCV